MPAGLPNSPPVSDNGMIYPFDGANPKKVVERVLIVSYVGFRIRLADFLGSFITSFDDKIRAADAASGGAK